MLALDGEALARIAIAVSTPAAPRVLERILRRDGVSRPPSPRCRRVGRLYGDELSAACRALLRSLFSKAGCWLGCSEPIPRWHHPTLILDRMVHAAHPAPLRLRGAVLGMLSGLSRSFSPRRPLARGGPKVVA